MRRYTPEALWFVACTAVLALTGIWGATEVGGPAPSFLALATLTIGACLAHLYPIRSAREGAFYVLSNVFLFSGVELLPPYLFAVLASAALVPMTWNQRRRPGALIRFAFNASQSTLAMLAAWSIITMGGALWEGAFAEVGLVLAAIIMFTAVQTGCVVVMIALNSRIPIARVAGIDLTSFLSDALMPFMGALVALVWQSRPTMLFLFLPPLVAVYQLMRNVQLIRQADLDAKTGLYNYSYFVQRMNQTLQYARLVRQPTAVLFTDMDLLREINNTHGHLAGDLAIKHVTTVLLKELPQNATVARFGGEEFVALLPGTDPAEAELIGWRVCREISRAPVEFGDGRQVRVTASIGVAGYPEHGATVEDLVHAADLAVYHAKARGRDRVISARSLSPEELSESRPDRKTARSSQGPAPAPDAQPDTTRTRQTRRRLLEVAGSVGRGTAAHYITLGSLGGCMVVGYQYLGLAGASLVVLPAALLYVNFGQRLRQSGARIAGLEQIRLELEAAQRQQKQSLDELVGTLDRALPELERCAGDQLVPAVVKALGQIRQREGDAFFTQQRGGSAAG